jgi:hypothetical protein
MLAMISVSTEAEKLRQGKRALQAGAQVQNPVRTALGRPTKFSEDSALRQLSSGGLTQFQPGKVNQEALTASDGSDDSLLSEPRELRSLHAKTLADFKQAAGAALLVDQWLYVFFVQFDSHALHDLFERQHNPETTLLPYHDAFHPGECAGADTRELPDAQQRVRFDPMLEKAGPQCLDRTIGKRRRLTPCTPYHRQRSGNTQDAYALRTLNTHKDIAREKWQVQCHSRPVAPFPVRLIKREVMLNFALTQMLRNAFFVTASRIESKPARETAGYFRATLGARSYDLDILKNASLQGFAILTWGEGIPQGSKKIGSKQQCEGLGGKE